jgi:hypothetical protein
VQLLDEDCFVHEAIPIYAGFHVTFPSVEVYIMAMRELELSWPIEVYGQNLLGQH